VSISTARLSRYSAGGYVDVANREREAEYANRRAAFAFSGGSSTPRCLAPSGDLESPKKCEVPHAPNANWMLQQLRQVVGDDEVTGVSFIRTWTGDLAYDSDTVRSAG
jgi:hypothetical protein